MGLRGPKPGTGQKKGGRKKGTPNKNKQALVDRIEGDLKCYPLDFIAEIAVQARSEGDRELTLQACKELAPYMYAKRKAVELSGKDGEAIKSEAKVILESM